MTGTGHTAGTAADARSRDDPTARLLRVVGMQFSLVAVGLHFVWGLPRAIVYLRAGTAADPRPYLFVVSGTAVVLALLGLYMVPESVPERPVYGFVASVMVVWLAGYAWWHLGGHGGAIPGVQGYGHPSLSNLDVLFSDQHLFQPLDFATAIAEVGALLAYGSLLVRGWLAD